MKTLNWNNMVSTYYEVVKQNDESYMEEVLNLFKKMRDLGFVSHEDWGAFFKTVHGWHYDSNENVVRNENDSIVFLGF